MRDRKRIDNSAVWFIIQIIILPYWIFGKKILTSDLTIQHVHTLFEDLF
jgi:hypothetical protein